MPPLYASYKPKSAPALEDCISSYERIAEVQIQEVDILICETMSSVKELHAAGYVASKLGKHSWVSGSVSDEDGSVLRSGETLEEGIKVLSELDIDAVLLNCSFPEIMTEGLRILSSLKLPYGGYANRFNSIEKLDPGGTVDVLKARVDIDEKGYASIVSSWINNGATIVGGCCEMGPNYISAIRDLLLEQGHNIVSEFS